MRQPRSLVQHARNCLTRERRHRKETAYAIPSLEIRTYCGDSPKTHRACLRRSLDSRRPWTLAAGPDISQERNTANLPPDQLDSLVAPIALYPDPLLSQVLVASTYPLEIVQLEQWLEKNKNLKDKTLADAVKKQDWDPSVQGLALLPDVAKYLADNIQVDH